MWFICFCRFVLIRSQLFFFYIFSNRSTQEHLTLFIFNILINHFQLLLLFIHLNSTTIILIWIICKEKEIDWSNLWINWKWKLFVELFFLFLASVFILISVQSNHYTFIYWPNKNSLSEHWNSTNHFRIENNHRFQ